MRLGVEWTHGTESDWAAPKKRQILLVSPLGSASIIWCGKGLPSLHTAPRKSPLSPSSKRWLIRQRLKCHALNFHCPPLSARIATTPSAQAATFPPCWLPAPLSAPFKPCFTTVGQPLLAAVGACADQRSPWAVKGMLQLPGPGLSLPHPFATHPPSVGLCCEARALAGHLPIVQWLTPLLSIYRAAPHHPAHPHTWSTYVLCRSCFYRAMADALSKLSGPRSIFWGPSRHARGHSAMSMCRRWRTAWCSKHRTYTSLWLMASLIQATRGSLWRKFFISSFHTYVRTVCCRRRHLQPSRSPSTKPSSAGWPPMSCAGWAAAVVEVNSSGSSGSSSGGSSNSGQ